MWSIPDSWQPPIISAILAFVGGILLTNYQNRKPRLISFFTNMSDFHIPSNQAGQPNLTIYTHTIVVQNTGKASANNVEVVHRNVGLQNYWHKVTPDVVFQQDRTPDGGLILRFPSLLPKQAVTISYLYTYPFHVDAIHNYVKSNEVAANVTAIFFVPQTPQWLAKLLLWLALFGLIYLIQLFSNGFVILIRNIAANR